MSVIRETTLLTDGDETSSTTPPPGNVDPGDVLYHKLIITNGGTTDATEVTIEDTFSGETMIAGTLNVSPIAFNDSFTAVGNTVLRVGTAGQQALGTNGNPSGNPSLIVLANVLSNDRGSSTLGTGVIAGDNIQGFQVRPATGTSSQDGSFTMFADGSFTYVNQAGDIGVDTFTYIIEDAGLDGNYATTGDNLTSMGTVSVTLTGEVWYVDGGAVSNGTGTSANPFNSITNLNTANKDGAGDTIYVKGLGIGAIVLEANQQLIGSGADLKVAGFTLANAGSNSTISSSGTNGYTVTVATNNTIAGIEIVGNGTNTGGITDNQAGSFGTLNLNPAALNAGTPGYQSTVNASGAALNLSDGTIAGNGLSSTTSMGSGAIVNNVSLTNITGTLALGTGLMTNASGASFNVSGGTVSTSYTGVLNHGLATGSLVSVSGGHATGTIAFTTGTLFSSAGGGLVFNDADGIYSLTGTTTINGGTSGLAITNGSSGSVSIGGTATMGATTSVGGIAITVADSTASLNFDMDVTHNTNFAILDVTNHSGGTLTFQTTATLDATNGTGLQFSNADGTYTMSSANVLHGGDAGIDIDTGSGGSFAFISNTAITNPTGDAFVVDNSTASVTFGGSITDNSGRVVHINQHDTTNNITFSTTSSIAATAGSTGILIQESNTGGTIAFNGQVQLTTTTNTAVTLTNNTGKTINFNADDLGLDITTTSGSGIVASNGGTITVSDVGSGNTINVTAGGGGGAVAFSALSTTIGAGGVTFDSINQTGGTNGIVLNGTGTGAFTVLGDQSQTSGLYDRDGSGGTISGTSGHAIALTNASNVTIRQMNLTNPTNVGSDGVNSNGGGSIRLQAVNIDAGGDSGWEAINLGGVNEFTHNSRVTDWQTVQSRGITVTNTNTNFTSFTIQNALFTTSATGADGFLFDAEGATSGDISVKNSEFTLLDDDGVQINNDGSGTIDAVIQGNNFHDADNTSGDGNNTLFLALAGSGKLNFQVGGLNPGEGNTFNNLARVQALTGAVAVNAATTGVSGGQLNGKIEGNTISNIFRRDAISFGIEANASTQGVHTIEVNNNVMNTNIGLMGIRTLLNSVAGGTLSGTNLTFKNNNIGNTGQSPLVTDDSRTGIEIESNWDNFASGGDMTTNVLLQGNTITNNGNGSGVGDTVEITVRGGNVGTNHIFNLTMFGNNMTNTGGANVLDILASPGTSQGTGVTLSVDLNSDNVPANANNTTNNAGAAGQIELRNNTTGGLFRIEDLGANAVATFVSQRNNNDTVLPTGVITTTGEVTMPTGASAFVSAEAPPPAAPIVVPVVEEPEQPAPTGSGTGDGGTGGTPDPDTDTGTGAPTGPVVVDDAVLSQAELDLIVDAAIARWAAAGATEAQLAAMRATIVQVGDLGGLTLGKSDLGTITLDDDAGGWRWFVDATPGDDSEYAGSGTRLGAVDAYGAAGTRMDLLTVVTHELGHQIGLNDSYAAGDRSELMYGTIAAGERRLVGGDDLAYAGDGPVTGAFAFAPIALGTIPAQRTVTVEWRATVNMPNEDRLVSAVLGQGILQYKDASDPVDPTGFKFALSNAQSFAVDSLSLGNLVYTDINKDGDYDAGTDTLMSGVTLRLYADSDNSGHYESGTDLAIVFFDSNGNGTYEQGIDEARAAGTTGANIVQLTATTNASGVYAFNSLAPGDYIVLVDSSNFGAGVLGNRRAHPSAPDPNLNQDGFNKAEQFLPGDPGTYAATRAIRLDYGLEPTAGPSGPAGDTNNTLDIGFDLPNQPPAIGALNGDAVTYTEDAPAVVLDLGGNATVDDPENGDFDAGTLTVQITGNRVDAEDILRVKDGGNVTVDFLNSKILYSGVEMATFTGGENGAALVITFNATASESRVQDVLHVVTYENGDTISPNTATRTVTFTLVDGDGNLNGGNDTSTATTTINVVAVNDPPQGDDHLDVAINEDATYVFKYIPVGNPGAVNDFNFNDDDGNIFAGVRIVDLPVAGKLKVNGVDVVANQVVSAADIQNGLFTYTPASNASGNDYASFTFQVIDNGSNVAPNDNEANFASTFSFDVAAVNDAPQSTGFDNVSFIEGGFYIQLDTGFDQVLTDVDSPDFDGGSLTVRVSVNEVASEDVIDFLTGGTSLLTTSGNTLSYNSVAFATFSRGVGQDLVFTFDADASVQAVQTIMRNLVYVNSNQSQPSTATRTIEYVLKDGDGGTLTLNSTVAVSTINDAPVLNGLGETLFDNLPANSAVRYSISTNQLADDFILDQASTVRSFTVQLSDGVANNDGLFNNFSGSISWAVYADGGDRPGALIASGTDAAPVVSDTGAQTPTNADIFFVNIDLGQNLALAAGSYWIALHENAWGSASDGTSISWVSGSNGSGDSVAYGLNLAAPPSAWEVDIYRDMTLRVNGPAAPVTFGENLVNATPQIIDADIAFSDPEGNLSAGTVTVSGLLAEDRVAIRHQGTGAGEIGVSGTNVTYANTVIGSFSGGTGSNFVVTLNGAATNAAVDALIQNLTYANVSNEPTATRTLTLTVADGTGASNADSIAINVTAQNDNPVLDLDGAGGADTAVGYAYEQDPTGTGSFAVAATVTDIDSTDFDTGTLAVGFTANAQAGDIIELPAFSGDPTHEVAIDGADVKYNNVVIGTYAAGDHDTALTVTFNASATAEAVQWVVRGIRVVHTGDAPSTAPRTLNYALTDGDGGSTSANASVNIQPDNDAPASTGPTYSLIGFNENAPVLQPLMDGVVLSDPDLPANFANGSLNLNVSGGEGGINLKAGSLFSIAADGIGGFDLVYDNAGTPVIIGKIAGFGTANMTVSAFTTEATLARLNDLVDDFGYIIVGDNPTPGDKTVTMTFNDGNNVGNGGTVAKTTIETQTLQVNAFNDAPTITNLAGDAPTFTEGGPPVWLDVGDNAVVADPDNADFGGHDLTVSISANYHFGDRITTGPDVTLSNLYNPGSTVTVDGAVIGTIQATAAGTLGIALNSNATLARVQILVRDFTFQTPSQDPTSDTRSIQLTIDNHSGNAVTVNSSVNVVAADDPPVANPDTASTAESAPVNIAVLTNDTELDGPPLAVAEINNTPVNPGDTVNLGNGATAKLELGGSITYNPNGAFNWLTEAGSGAVNTSAVQIFTYKLVGGTATTNVSVTVNGQISSDDILYGDGTDNVITGTPQRDIFHVQQGGNDTVHGLATGDTFYFGAAFTAGDTVNGGDGADAIILQGNYPALTFGTGVTSNISSVESISLAPGSITAYGDTANNFYDYDLTTLNSNVAAGGILKINGFLLRAGEDLTFNGAAETDGTFIILAGQGVDSLTGGGQGDIFVFGHDGRFGSADVVNGGAGYDTLYLRGDYSLDFTAAGFTGSISGIDSIALASTTDLQFTGGGDGEFDYAIVWDDAMLATGSTITVNGSGLGLAETMVFNGADEAGGHFRLWGGAAADTLTGGGGNDLIYGGRGADQLRGNGGADTFRYQATNESPVGLANVDTILDFVHGVDKIDLSVIDAKVIPAGDQAFTFIGSAAFTAAGPNSAGQLRAVQTDVATNTWQVHGDTDGNGTADFVLQVIVDPLQSLTVGDFVL